MDDDSAPAVHREQGDGATEALAYRLRQQRLLADYGNFALRIHATQALLQEATRVCAQGMNSRLCKILEYLPDSGEFIVRAGVGWKPGVVGRARLGAESESPAGYAFQTGNPVISNHLSAESRFRTPAILVDHDVKRAINVLIQGDSQRFGVLEIDSPDEGRFSEADLAFMQGFANLVGVAIERQQVETAWRATEVRLHEAIAHQEVLTREISHRVKNSLSIVAGLLNMQGRMSRDPQVQRALADAQTRVHTVAQVHDRLWRQHEARTIDLAEFLDELCEQLQASAAPGQTLAGAFEPVTVATDQAVPLGLLVNELVTNAFKYAYPDESGEVHVTVRTTEPGRLQLTVTDRGQGLPPDFDAEQSRSLGMKLIASLSRQLGGHPQWQDAGPGTRFTLDFSAQMRPANDE